MSGVRERELLRHGAPTLVGRRIALGHHGGIGSAVDALRHRLTSTGAVVATLMHPDGMALAAGANVFEAELYVGLGLDLALEGSRLAFYRGYTYESAGGRRLAELVRAHLDDLPGSLGRAALCGMTLPELRHSRMPAVVCDLATAVWAVSRASELAEAIAEAMAEWVAVHWD